MNALLGAQIKALRTAKNLTQEQIAAQLGISRRKYAHIESGAHNISLDILSKIADILDVTVRDITRVADQTPAMACRTETSSQKIFDMLDLFYANKHLYMKLQHNHMA